MANVVPDSFKTDLLKGTFNFDSSGGSTFKLALYTNISAGPFKYPYASTRHPYKSKS